MTRKEEIKQAAFNNDRESSKENQQYFIEGAEWADSNPNPELKKQWLEKAVKWLTENAFRYVVKRTYNEVKVTGLHTSMVEDFKEYMKGE